MSVTVSTAGDYDAASVDTVPLGGGPRRIIHPEVEPLGAEDEPGALARVLPVYEIFKAGSDLYWADGLNVLGAFGLELAIVPHWNNTDGGADVDAEQHGQQPRSALGAIAFEDRLKQAQIKVSGNRHLPLDN